MKWPRNCPFLTKATKFGDKRNKAPKPATAQNLLVPSRSREYYLNYFELSLDDTAPKSPRHGSSPLPPGTSTALLQLQRQTRRLRY